MNGVTDVHYLVDAQYFLVPSLLAPSPVLAVDSISGIGSQLHLF